jgi:DNA-binding NtrC family response regulator
MKIVPLMDASENDRFLLQEEFSEEGTEVIPANSIEEVLSKFEKIQPDLLISEVRQKDVKEETLEKIKEHWPDIPLIGHSTSIQCQVNFRDGSIPIYRNLLRQME